LALRTLPLIEIWPNEIEEVSWPPQSVFLREHINRFFPKNGITIINALGAGL